MKIIKVDYSNKKQAEDLTFLLNEYACDRMGGGTALSQFTKDNLTKELSKLPHAFSVMCYVNKQPAGLINCFESFSTFSCKPLVNIHDIVVLKEYRGNNLSQLMLREVEEIAKRKGCCKLTLEVLSGNEIAKSSYTKYGFSGYELDPDIGNALFWQKLI